jgi:hypothetical protein
MVRLQVGLSLNRAVFSSMDFLKLNIKYIAPGSALEVVFPCGSSDSCYSGRWPGGKGTGEQRAHGMLSAGEIKITRLTMTSMSSERVFVNRHPLLVKVRLQPHKSSSPIVESVALWRNDNDTGNRPATSSSEHEAFLLLAYGFSYPGRRMRNGATVR